MSPSTKDAVPSQERVNKLCKTTPLPNRQVDFKNNKTQPFFWLILFSLFTTTDPYITSKIPKAMEHTILLDLKKTQIAASKVICILCNPNRAI